MASGTCTQLIDADGHVTNYTYDANGNPLSQTQADGSGWSLTYNANGMPTSIGLIGLPRTIQYNALNQITQLTDAVRADRHVRVRRARPDDPDHAPRRYHRPNSTYDAAGNLVAVTDSLGNVTRYAYDAKNRLIQTTYADGSTEKRTYDLAGQLVEVTDALGNTHALCVRRRRQADPNHRRPGRRYQHSV